MATRNSLKRRASEDISSDSFNTTPPKKNKANPRAKTTRSVPRTSQRARKPVVKREKSGVSEGASFKSHLVPRGTRKTAKVGQRDESLLRMLCDDSVSGEAKELHFRNIPHSSIDWNDVEHINKINNWRNRKLFHLPTIEHPGTVASKSVADQGCLMQRSTAALA